VVQVFMAALPAVFVTTGKDFCCVSHAAFNNARFQDSSNRFMAIFILYSYLFFFFFERF
jgi:hypothetical protein